MKHNLNVEVVTITPEMAAEILEMNENNRPLRKLMVKKYASDMREGRWALNGEAIQMNGTRLLNGQHRLEACIEANVPFTTLLVRGVDSSLFSTFDQHGKRTGGDVLAIMGVKDHNVVASASRLTAAFQMFSKLKNPVAATVALAQSGFDVSRWIIDNPLMEHSARAGIRGYSNARFLVPSVLAAFHFMASKISAQQADEFLEMLVMGNNIDKGHPCLALRNSMILRAAMRSKDRPEYVLTKHIHAWNAYRRGRQLITVRVNPDDVIPAMV
jgi:hypothetical protein